MELILVIIGICFSCFLGGVGLGYTIGYNVGNSSVETSGSCYCDKSKDEDQIPTTVYYKGKRKIRVECCYLLTNKKCSMDNKKCHNV